MGYLKALALSVAMLLAGCENPSSSQSSPADENNQTTSPVIESSTSSTLMYMAGMWVSECLPFLRDHTLSNDLPDIYHRVFLQIGIDAMVGNHVEQQYLDYYLANSPNMAITTIYFSDAECIHDYWSTHDTLPSPPVNEKYLPTTAVDVADTVAMYYTHPYIPSKFSYLVGSPITTADNEDAMEVDFLLNGTADFMANTVIGDRYVYRNLFAITDNGNTLLLGENSELTFLDCLVANQDAIVPTNVVWEFVYHNYEGITLFNLPDYNTTAYHFDTVQTYSPDDSASVTYYGEDLNLAFNIISGVSAFSEASAVTQNCGRPNRLDHAKPYTRVDIFTWSQIMSSIVY